MRIGSEKSLSPKDMAEQLPQEAIELSVISPMYNEELVIEKSIQGLIDAISQIGITWELILVNDGSTDNTERILQQFENKQNIRIISYKINRGRGYALRMGFKHCRGRYVVTTESDLTWGKSVIQNLYTELMQSDVDVVVASPYAKGGRLENVPFKRVLLSLLGNRILRLTVPLPITMLSGMTRGYAGDFIRNLSLEEDRKEIHLEIISKSVMLNARFSEIPAILRWEPPKPGVKKRKSKFKAKKLILSHLLFGFHEAPILLFGGLGSLSIASGISCGLYLSYLYFIKNALVGDRFVLIMLTIFLILAGLSMFVFCFLAYQIKMVRRELFNLLQKTTSSTK